MFETFRDIQRPSRRASRLSRLFLACGLAAGLALAGPLAAQNAPAAPPSVFGEVIDVRVVNLEVVVTDKSGVRVNGLKPSDFILTVDGREVPIEYFTEVNGGTAVLQGDQASTSTLPALAPGETVSTSYLVFIDDFFSIPTHRNRVINDLVDQLPLLGPSDRMAVVAFDGEKVEMLSTWSSSVESLTRVFERARDRPAYGLQRRSEHRIFDLTRRDQRLDPSLRSRGLSDLSALDRNLDVDERHQAEILSSQIDRTVLAATSALRGFANPPGRKVMLMLAGGWPFNPAQWVVRDPERAVFVREADYGERLYRPLIETANRLSYTLYPVDVPGLEPSPIDTESDVDAAGLNENRSIFSDRERAVETTLAVLAQETGGKAFVDGGSSGALQRVYEDTRSYYWLGFTPTWEGDDESHNVKLDTRQKGLQVRSRESFSDLSRQTEVTMMVESSLLFGNPPSEQPLTVEVGEEQKSGRRAVVPLRVRIPVDVLTFLPQGDAFIAETELRVAVQDDTGGRSEVPVIPLNIRLRQRPEAGQFTVYETGIKLRNREHEVVISLYDIASGKILSQKLTIDPSK